MDQLRGEGNEVPKYTLQKSITALRIIDEACYRNTVSTTVDRVYILLGVTTSQDEIISRIVDRRTLRSVSDDILMIIRYVYMIMARTAMRIHLGNVHDEVIGRIGVLTEERIKLIHKEIQSLKRRHFGDRNDEVNNYFINLCISVEILLGVVTINNSFKKKPSHGAPHLWVFLDAFASAGDILEQSPCVGCPVCQGKDFKPDDDFAINDVCSHLLCIKCAEQIYNVTATTEA